MWFSSWTGFSRGNVSCLRYCFWLTGFPGWNFQSHLGNLPVHTCTMNLSRKCHLNPMSRCEIFWDVGFLFFGFVVLAFSYPSLFAYSKFAVSFISLFASLFFLLIVSLSIKAPHISLPTDSYFSLFLLLLLAFSVVLTSFCLQMHSLHPHSSVSSVCPIWPVAPSVKAESSLLLPIQLIKWKFTSVLPPQQWGYVDHAYRSSSPMQEHQCNCRNTLCSILWHGGAGRERDRVKRNWPTSAFLGDKSLPMKCSNGFEHWYLPQAVPQCPRFSTGISSVLQRQIHALTWQVQIPAHAWIPRRALHLSPCKCWCLQPLCTTDLQLPRLYPDYFCGKAEAVPVPNTFNYSPEYICVFNTVPNLEHKHTENNKNQVAEYTFTSLFNIKYGLMWSHETRDYSFGSIATIPHQ